MTLTEAPDAPPQPVAPSERIDAIDVVRGLALFGVLAVNVVTEFRVSIFEQFLPPASPSSPLDGAVEAILKLAIQSKAFALFSLLFGVGLAVQFERLDRNARRTTLLARRLAVLLLIGLAHMFLIWNGDILAEYALAGFLVLPFLFGPRWLLAAGGLSFLGFYLIMPLLAVALLPDAAWMTRHVAEARSVYGTGTFSDILAFRIREVPSILPLHVSVFPRTVSLFLFGAYVWRTGLLQRASLNRHLLLGVSIIGIAAGMGSTFVSDGMPFPDGLLWREGFSWCESQRRSSWRSAMVQSSSIS